jgi:hypothetical protein
MIYPCVFVNCCDVYRLWYLAAKRSTCQRNFQTGNEAWSENSFVRVLVVVFVGGAVRAN